VPGTPTLQKLFNPRRNPATTQAWTERDGSAGAPQPCRDATQASQQHHEEGPRLGVAGRPHTGASTPTSVAAPREDLSAGLTGETASENSLVEGGEGAFNVSATSAR
jgi:hypothetical protein